jgi:uncharacterized protein
MMIDWQSFTPYASLIGGIIIGLATALLLILNGKIAGISGIVGGLLSNTTSDKAWRLAFVIGLMISPLIWQLFTALPTISVSNNAPLLIIAGLLVGVGTRIGSGCTSGHGICGLSRFSLRSIVATGTFMTIGILTTTLIRHVFI